MIEHVPPHIFGALYRYYKHNCQPGSCTSAIIKAVNDSDIYDAATRADQLTKAHFADIIMFVGKHANNLHKDSQTFDLQWESWRAKFSPESPEISFDRGSDD